jgi:hypothetical protein
MVDIPLPTRAHARHEIAAEMEALCAEPIPLGDRQFGWQRHKNAPHDFRQSSDVQNLM